MTDVLEMLEHEPRTWADRMRDEGRAEGRRSGLVAMLLRQTRMRFGGGMAEKLERLLEGITEIDRLEDICEWVVVCESGEALLARLREV